MTIPTVTGSALSEQTGNVTDSVVVQPTGIVAGELLLSFLAEDSPALSNVWPAGWTELYDSAGTGFIGTVGWRQAAGSDANPSVVHTTERSNHIALRIADWDTSVPPEVSTKASGSSTTPDSPSFTPSWGSADTLFITVLFDDASGVVTAWPTNCPDNHLENHTATSAADVALATVGNSGGAFNPDAFTVTLTDTWDAITIAVKGVSAGAGAALAGAPAGVSTVAGALTDNPAAALAGLSAGVSTVAGDLTPVQAHALAGLIAAMSSASGTLLMDTPPSDPPYPVTPYLFFEIWAPIAGSARWDMANWDSATWAEFDWIDITDKVQNAKFGWGADDASQGILTQVAANAPTLFTYDPDRELDPSNDESLLYAALRPGTRMRIRWTDTLELYYMKEGVIDTITYSIQTQRGQIRMVDRVSHMANAKVPAGQTGVPTTLRAAARHIIEVAGLDEFIEVFEPDPPEIDPAIAGAIAEETTVWDWLNVMALDALCAVAIVPKDETGVYVYFPSFETVVTTGTIIGGSTGIPIEDVNPESSLSGVYSQVIAFDDSAPTVPITVQSDDAVNKFGKVPFKRERVHPNAATWAGFVLADRSGANLQYQMGILRPTSFEHFEKLQQLRMLDEVQLKASNRDNGSDPIENPVNVFVRVLGLQWEANTKSGWSARVIAYVATPNWT